MKVSRRGVETVVDRFIPGAMFIPDETPAPLMVREEGAVTAWTAPLRTGMQPDSSLWQ